MATPGGIHHQLLRPSVLHILRAAGYQSTRPSVLDSLTDIAARYMALLATTAAKHAELNHGVLRDGDEPEIDIVDVRMAMQDCGVLGPERLLEEQGFGRSDEEEDMRGVEAFIDWATGKESKEIRRVALEGMDESAEDFLSVLKRKHDKTEDGSRYHGTILGEEIEPRVVSIEGGDITNLDDWTDRLHTKQRRLNVSPHAARRQSSDLSSIGDDSVGGLEFD